MSKIEYTNGDKVKERKGEFFTADSCYTTPKSIHTMDIYNDPMFAALEGNVDELMNKPRRFFDHLLSIMEYKRDNAKSKGEQEKYEYLIMGCELWLSAVNNGVFGEVLKYAEPTSTAGKKLLKDWGVDDV